MQAYNGLLWFIITLVPFIYIQWRFRFEVFAVFYILTRSKRFAIGLESILFLPGVFLHEVAHYSAARIMGVRTYGFSIFPTYLPDGSVLAGYVETEKTGCLRGAVIGIAPLLFGSLFVGYAGVYHLYTPYLWQVLADWDIQALIAALKTLSTQTEFWGWFYLTLTVSSHMFPSRPDMRMWPYMILASMILLGIALAFGAGEWLSFHVMPVVNEWMRAAAMVFGTSMAVNGLLLIPLGIVRFLLTTITGMEISTSR